MYPFHIMYSRPATALSAVFGFISLAAALPTDISARDLPPISYPGGTLSKGLCDIGLQFDQSNSNVGLTIWDGNGVVLGTALSTQGTKNFDFDSRLQNVLVIDVPKSYSNNDIKNGTPKLKWSYGKHKGAMSGADEVACGSADDWSKKHVCLMAFECNN